MVRTSFLQQFDPAPVFQVLDPGAACCLSLRGRPGALDVVGIYGSPHRTVDRITTWRAVGAYPGTTSRASSSSSSATSSQGH
eukprot:11882954-Prorocentrum_lima.AAC.1